MDFSEDAIFGIIQSNNPFPVDFEDAWRWIGYSRKSDAKKCLETSLEEGFDFCGELRKITKVVGRPRKCIYLSIDGFKMFCQSAGTEKAKQVRRYFVECERQLKQRLEAEQQNKQTHQIKDYVLDKALPWNTTQTGERPFVPEFYEHLYRIRGGEWLKRNPRLGQKPGCVGSWTNQFVYDFFPGSVPKALNEQYKSQEGSHRKYEFLTKIKGRSHLLLHMASLLTVMRVSPDDNWSRFLANVQKAFPNPDDISAIQLEFDFLLGMEEEWAKSQR
jgi:phage anti-repressor protein